MGEFDPSEIDSILDPSTVDRMFARIMSTLDEDEPTPDPSRRVVREAFVVEPHEVLPELEGKGLPEGHVAFRGDFDNRPTDADN